LRIERPVLDVDGWKRAFDCDPVGRKKAGVGRYQVLRSIDDPNYVMIDLEFDTQSEAGTLLAAMREVRSRVEGKVVLDPLARIVESVESKEYCVQRSAAGCARRRSGVRLPCGRPLIARETVFGTTLHATERRCDAGRKRNVVLSQ